MTVKNGVCCIDAKFRRDLKSKVESSGLHFATETSSFGYRGHPTRLCTVLAAERSRGAEYTMSPEIPRLMITYDCSHSQPCPNASCFGEGGRQSRTESKHQQNQGSRNNLSLGYLFLG